MTHFIFDCDDVLLDWESGFRAFHDRFYGHVRILPQEGPQSWALHEWLDSSPHVARQYVEQFNTSPAFDALAPRPGAYDLLWSLEDAGHTISVLTACGDARSIRLARSRNLYNAFARDYRSPFTTIEHIALGASKFDWLYNISRHRTDLVYVEDAFHHAQSGVANGIRTYCLRRSHNRAAERENPETSVVWIDSLDQLYGDW